jgi:hypothetical protein
MSVGTANHGGYPLYRCSPTSDCSARVTVSADLVERVVVEEVKRLLEGVTGSASGAESIEGAERDVQHVEHELDAAVAAFSGLDDVAAARDRLLELREQRDQARDRVAELQAAVGPRLTVAAGDWDVLTLAERRALIRAVLDRVDVAPGRGADRITIQPRGQ